MELADFLLARIEEDEEAAREGERIYVWITSEPDADWRPDPQDLAGVVAYRERFDPARIYAECDAKRRIVERAQAMEYAGVQLIGTQMAGILADLALPYASHPGYQQEWRS